MVAISALLRRLRIGSAPFAPSVIRVAGSVDPNNRSSSPDTRYTLSSLFFPF